jgi:hypothetical protein
MSDRDGRALWVAALLAASLALRLHYALVAPWGIVFENGISGSDDEAAHVNYVKALAIEGRIPVQTESVKAPGAFERNAFEYYQPPLYYAAAAVAYRAATRIARGGELLAARLLSVGLAMAQILLAWPILRRALPGRGEAEAALVVTAFLGSQIKATTFVSNDAAIFALFTWTLLLLVRIAERRTARREALLVAALALAWLTKSSTLVLALIVPAAYAAQAPPGRRRRALGRGLALVAASAILAAPWFARSIRLYGDPFALSIGGGTRFGEAMSAAEAIRRIAHVPYEIFFGWYIESPPRYFTLITGLEYAALAAAVVALAAGDRAAFARRLAPAPARGPARRLALLLLAASFAAYAWYAIRYGYFGPRQALGALPGLAVLLALPAIAASRATGGRVPAPLAAALLVVPKHFVHLARWL